MSRRERWLVPLRELDAPDAGWAGGKAAGLGAARRHGARVSAGWVLAPGAVGRLLDANNLALEWTVLRDRIRRDEGDWEARARAFAALLRQGRVPHGLAAALTKLPGERLAVRSSAALEDRAEASAAGAYLTRLDVSEGERVSALLEVLASQFEPPAFARALEAGLDPGAHAANALLMPMLVPTAAGVLFTTDPTDPTRTHGRLAWRPGRGDAVVDGQDAFEARYPKAGALPEAAGLDGPRAGQLRHLAERLERRTGRALDLEFAFAKGGLWLLQARPIVGLAPGAERTEAIFWSRELAAERFPDPISPLGWSALASALAVNLATLRRHFGVIGDPPEAIAKAIGGYVYHNRDFFSLKGNLSLDPAFWLRQAPWLLGALLRDGPGLLLTGKGGPAFGDRLGHPRQRALMALYDRLVFGPAQAVEADWARDFEAHLAHMEALAAEEPERMDAAGRRAYATRLMAASDAFMEPDLAIYAVKMACRFAVEQLAALALGAPDPERLSRLTAGLADNATLALHEALDDLAARVRAGDPPLAAALAAREREGLPEAWAASPLAARREAFLARYGHVTLSWDLRQPPLAERPGLLDAWLGQRLSLPSEARAEQAARREALARAREAETDSVARALAAHPRLQAFFERALTTLHRFMALDEAHHLFCARLIPAERRLILAWAEKLARLEVLARPDDVFFLTLPELFALLDEPDPASRARLCRRRRVAFERAMAQDPPPAYWGEWPMSPEPEAEPEAGRDRRLVQGRCANPGLVEGRVRIVTSLVEMGAFRPGEIAVLATPKPSLTPIFAVAAGVVTATGATLSHGLVLAREYGLPALTDAPDALSKLKTGQRVRLDATRGRLEVLEEAPHGDAL